MAGVFEGATRVAIEEIIKSHLKESKFGYVLTKESLEELKEDVLEFFLTSRNLKTAGDRYLAGQAPIKKNGYKEL